MDVCIAKFYGKSMDISSAIRFLISVGCFFAIKKKLTQEYLVSR